MIPQNTPHHPQSTPQNTPQQTPQNTPPTPPLKEPESTNGFAADFMRRIRQTRATRWVRFSIVALIFILWVAWLGNWWVALFIFLLFDIYITGYIPFTWWKESKNPVVRTVMSWVDAIVYALILVYFVFTFVGQNYQIPSSSLEKSLLVGDYLVVNKMAYGPRVPMTPIHFPLVQNTFPIINTKSYIEWPQWTYHRLKGLGNVERGDIVVFNFPAGDTVALKMQNPDYYTLLEMYGRSRVWADKEMFGDIIYRPVDRRENYVKRAIGLPGDSLAIRDGVVYINGKPLPQPRDVQFNRFVQMAPGAAWTDADFEALGIALDDRHMMAMTDDNLEMLRLMGFEIPAEGHLPNIYVLPMTEQMVATARADSRVARIDKVPAWRGDFLFPMALSTDWTRADYGPVWIPRKGDTVKLDADSWPVYERAIRNYEYNTDAHLGTDGRVYIGGKPVDSYTFKMDYYFMMGDNRDNSLDSRYWGFVPEDHIVGRPELVLISFDKDKGLLSGGIRFNRMFTRANHDK